MIRKFPGNSRRPGLELAFPRRENRYNVLDWYCPKTSRRQSFTHKEKERLWLSRSPKKRPVKSSGSSANSRRMAPRPKRSICACGSSAARSEERRVGKGGKG